LLLATDGIQKTAGSEEKKRKKKETKRKKEQKRRIFQIIHNLKKIPVPERFCK